MQRKFGETKDSNNTGKTFGVITSGCGSSSCTMYKNGGKVVSANGKTTYTAPDGTVSSKPGTSYTTTSFFRDGKSGVDVVVDAPSRGLTAKK